MQPTKRPLHLPEDCDPVEIIDQKTGLEKFVYLCTKPIKNRTAHYRKHTLHFWTDLVLVGTITILIAVIASLYIFNKTRLANAVDFQVNYDESALINGQTVKFDIAYENTSKRLPVSDATVLIKFPEGLRNPKVSVPDFNEAENTIYLGSLQPQDHGQFEVSGQLLANLGEKEKFLFVLTYKNPAGQIQQEFSSKEFVVEKSVVNVDLQVPTKIILGSELTATTYVTNNAGAEFTDLKLKANFPSGYLGQPTETVLEKLAPAESVSKEFTGSISQGAAGPVTFEVVLIHHFEDRDYILSRGQAMAEMIQTKFSLGFVEPEKTANLNPGDQATLNLALENNEKETINDLSVSMMVDGVYTDYGFLQKQYGDNYASQSVRFPEITSLEPGQNKSISLNVAALPFIQVKAKPSLPAEIAVYAKVSYRLGSDQTLLTQTSRRLVIPINSTLTLKSYGLFETRDGDQIGVGSIPPRPGEYTAYWAIIELMNGVNKLRNVTLKADIPANVEYDGLSNVTIGTSVRQISGQSTLEWYIPELEAYDGIISVPGQARIQLAVVPDETDIGKILPLLKNIRITGIDDRTGYQVSASGKDVTTAVFTEAEKNKVAR